MFEELHTKGVHYLFTLNVITPKMTTFKFENSDKDNLWIISKPHAHVQILIKTSVKFQKNCHKIKGGFARTMYLLL